jgi:thiaminase/transcriptional activator TenA
MTYAVPEFRDMVNWWFDILDRAVSGLPEPELGHIREIFLTSCRYEWMFWDLGWNKEEWKPQ